MTSELKISLTLDQIERVLNELRYQGSVLANVESELMIIRKLLRLRRPEHVRLRVVREENEMLRFVLVLPPTRAADVVSRRLTVIIDDASAEVEELSPTAAECGEHQGPDGALVSGSLIDIDDAGNMSEPREYSFVLSDTIPPPLPGEMGLRITGEE